MSMYWLDAPASMGDHGEGWLSMAVLIFRGERGTLKGVWVPVRLGDCPPRLQ